MIHRYYNCGDCGRSRERSSAQHAERAPVHGQAQKSIQQLQFFHHEKGFPVHLQPIYADCLPPTKLTSLTSQLFGRWKRAMLNHRVRARARTHTQKNGHGRPTP